MIDRIASRVKISKATAGKVLDARIESIRKALRKSERVRLVGFGTFSVIKRRTRKGRNPKTGEEIKIPAGRVLNFRAG